VRKACLDGQWDRSPLQDVSGEPGRQADIQAGRTYERPEDRGGLFGLLALHSRLQEYTGAVGENVTHHCRQSPSPLA